MFSEVLRLSKSAKPLCEGATTLLPLWLLSKRMENSRREFYVSEDRNFQECNGIPTVQNNPPGEWSNMQLSMHGHPMKLTPLVNTFHNVRPKFHHSLSQCLLVRSYKLLFKGTSKISSCSQQHQKA